VRFGIVADDNTGATDAAGMLTERGVRTVLFIDAPGSEGADDVASGYDAAVVGTNARSVPPAAAYRRTAEAVRTLARMHAEKFQIKYCSTFDSTPEGNIGPCLDAAMEVLKTDATVVSPALPVNGRTTYCGYHFVKGELLSESPLKDHPLNPMTDSNLVRWLQMQTERKVSLAPLAVIRRGAKVLEGFLRSRIERGEAYFVTDTLEQNDLTTIARATATWPLISGGSGITAEVPGILFPGAGELSFCERLKGFGRETLVIAGSCSPATRDQNAFALRNGFAGLHADGREILDDSVAIDEFADRASGELERSGAVVLYASSGPDEVECIQAHGASKGLSATEVGERVAAFLSEVGARLIERGRIGRLVVSGGETSGAVCHRLGIRALEVGLPVDPGVPYCFPIDGPDLVVCLKSGNFGARDFYWKVQGL